MFKQAIWRDMWTLTFQKIAHATYVTLPLFKQANWEDKDMCNITFGKIAHMQLMWLMWLFKQAIWEDMCNIIFGKITHMQLMWLFICWSSRFEKTCENWHLRKPHTCNYCDFASVQEGDIRRLKNHIKENRTTANEFPLHVNRYQNRWIILSVNWLREVFEGRRGN